ncbi:MAG: sugar phosphate isomerase/epimerase [Candidatus Nealsonbacteria bacterium]|nr:sugar phosphate isomerase/epimerase [Candidatus Nealsonbacteria bacterium]
MSETITRRKFFAISAVGGCAATVGLAPRKARTEDKPADGPLRLGLMTYRLGAEWDLETILKNCREVKWEHAELRTTHAHGVEVGLSKTQRREVRKKAEDAGIKLSLASAFSYHWEDPQQVRKNIEGTKEYTLLAEDIGALGIRVFPNAILVDKGIPEEKTLEQIGKAVAEAARFGADHGVEIRLANHGRGTNRISRTKKILDYADSPHVYVNWNCDGSDVEEPGFEAHFNMVKDRIRNIHLHDLHNEKYPYRKLFALLRKSGYRGYCDAEVGPSLEPVTFMKYYRALFLALQNVI